MNIVVLRETQVGEARVALMPESVTKLTALKASVMLESDAGLAAARSNDDYREAGAGISQDRTALISSADVLVTVNRPEPEVFNLMKRARSCLVSCGRSTSLRLWNLRWRTASRLLQWS